MATDRRKHLAVTFLNRTGCLLAAVAVVFAWIGQIPAAKSASGPFEATRSSVPERPTSPSVAGEAIVDGDIQVAVAEAYSLSPADWQRLLSGLSAELRLGLAVEVALPATTSNDEPPLDSLIRLLWAKTLLHRHRIELRVEQDTIRVVPLAAPTDSPAEA